MGKWNPDVPFKELIKIHKLIKTFEDWDLEELGEYDKLEEGYVKEEYENLKAIEIDRDKSMFGFKIELLKYSDLHSELSLQEYIIYLIILEFNLQQKTFNRENTFITNLTGIPVSTVEVSIKNLLSNEFIKYVDKNGEYCDSKPLTEKLFQEWKDENKNVSNEYLEWFSSKVNNKRELVVNYLPLEEMNKSIAVTEEERIQIINDNRDKRKAKRIKDEKCNRALIHILQDRGNRIYNDEIPKLADENYRIENQKLWNSIESKLMEQEITIDDLLEYLKNR